MRVKFKYLESILMGIVELNDLQDVIPAQAGAQRYTRKSLGKRQHGLWGNGWNSSLNIPGRMKRDSL